MAKRYIKRKSAVKPITGSIVDTTNIDDKSKNTYSAGVIDDKISKAGGVEVGTIVHIPKTKPTPEGYEDVTDENVPVKILASEIMEAKTGYTNLADSTILKQGNRYWGTITVKKNEGKIPSATETAILFKKTVNNRQNTGCFLSDNQWNTRAVGYCYISNDSIIIGDPTNTYNFAKITFDITTTEESDTKPIKKVAVTEVPKIEGSIVDGTNIDDKVKNTYSANVIDKLNSYSTTEQVIGMWIDGKPIYRKVIQASDLIAGIGNQIPTGIENLDIVVDINGTVNNSEYFQGTSKAHLKSFDFQIGTCYNKSTNCVEIDVGANLSGYSANIILEYTKTTD